MARTRALIVCFLATGCVAASASAASAACNDFWTGGGHDGDWATAGNWSAGVPLETSNVCIDDSHGQSGAYTVNIDTYKPALVANSITLGGSAGNLVTLAILGTGGGVQVGNTLTLTNQDAGEGITPNGAVTLGSDTETTTQPGAIVVKAGTLSNQGTVTSTSTGSPGAFNSINGSFENQGTLDIDQNFSAALGTWTSSGTINVEAGQQLQLNDPSESPGSSFTQAGGTISNLGSLHEENAGFVALGGTSTGNPMTFDRTIMSLPGSGTGLFHVEGGAKLVGDIGAGYTLWGSGIPGLTHGTLLEEGSLVNHGTVELGSLDGTHGTLNVASGTFTNDGQLTFLNTANGPDGLDGVLVNSGTVSVLGGVEGSGAITNNASFSLSAGDTFSATSFGQGAGGTLALAVTGGGTPSVPKLQLSGAAALAGALAIGTTGGVATGTFPVIAAESSSATFGSSNFSGESYSLAYSPKGLSITGPAATPVPIAAPASQPIEVGSILGGTGELKIALSCPATATACDAAQIKATVTEHLKGSKLVALSAGKKSKAKTRTKQVTVASSSTTLAKGTSKTFVVKLNHAGQRLLAKHSPLATLVTVVSGAKTVKSATVHVKRAKTKKPKKKAKKR